MKNNKYIWISVAILGVGGYFIYKNLLQKPTRSKQENIDLIVDAGMSKNVNNLLSTYDERFLSEWAKAIEKNEVTFSYKFKRYNTKGGTSVK